MLNPATLWAEVQLFQEPLIMLYGLSVHALATFLVAVVRLRSYRDPM
jgi:hypothetical protein